MRVEQWNETYADEVAAWRYEPPWDFYALASDPADAAAMRDPSRAGHLRAVLDESGRRLEAFRYFDWHADVVEVGIGLRPDLTGRGLGEIVPTRAARICFEPLATGDVSTFRCGLERAGNPALPAVRLP